MKNLISSICLLSVLSSTKSVKCKPKHCVKYHYRLDSIADKNAVVGGATFDFKEQKFLLDLTLTTQDSYAYTYGAVKIHLHHRGPDDKEADYSTCQGLGLHYDPTYHCGPKSEYNTTICKDPKRKRGAYEAGDITEQYKHKGISLTPGKEVKLSFPFKKFKYVEDLSLVMHANKGDKSEIIACSKATIIKC